jgi:hypothetical protein
LDYKLKVAEITLDFTKGCDLIEFALPKELTSTWNMNKPWGRKFSQRLKLEGREQKAKPPWVWG